MLTIANPLGLWALLGIPAVLAIHFLQRQAVILPVSTLFLLEKTQRESASGRRFDRLMNSIPLWMQLLSVLLLTWILAEPRYQRAQSTQRIAVVLDSSASMLVFKDEIKERVSTLLPELQGQASTVELTLLESSPGRSRSTKVLRSRSLPSHLLTGSRGMASSTPLKSFVWHVRSSPAKAR